MITGWLLKIVLSFLLVGLIAFEVGSPLLVRAQLDEVAHDAADQAAVHLSDTNDLQRARAIAEEVAGANRAILKTFAADQGGVHVTVERQARSIILKKLEQAESWYDVEVSATAPGRGG